MSDAPESFTDRFNRLTAHLTDGRLMDLLGLTATPLAKLKSGETKTLKLAAGLRLAHELGVSPWYLAGEREPGAIRITYPDAYVQVGLSIESRADVAPPDETRRAEIREDFVQGLASTVGARHSISLLREKEPPPLMVAAARQALEEMMSPDYLARIVGLSPEAFARALSDAVATDRDVSPPQSKPAGSRRGRSSPGSKS